MSNIELNKIYEDCLDTMAKMEEDMIDLVVTSPPYDNLRKYNGYSLILNRLPVISSHKPRVIVWVVKIQ